MQTGVELSLTILHFDDEPDSVAPIAVSIVNLYSGDFASWLQEDRVVYNDFLEEFVIQPPNLGSLKVNLRLLDSVDKSQIEVDRLSDTDIAIFDLMRENTDGQIEHVGIELYRLAQGKGVPESRLFVLSGFPHLLENEVQIPAEQKLLKPIAPNEVAIRLVSLFPDGYRPGGI